MFRPLNLLRSNRRSFYTTISYVVCFVLVISVVMRNGRWSSKLDSPAHKIEKNSPAYQIEGNSPTHKTDENSSAHQIEGNSPAHKTEEDSKSIRFKEDNLEGYIWPKPGSLDDRIVNQMNFMSEYAAKKKIDTRPKKIILRVGNFNFDDLHWIDGEERLLKDNCPIKNCLFSSNRTLAKVADALLISQFDGSQLQFYTPKPPHQIWITQHLESPHHNRLDPAALRNLVNWTVSFRQESTIALPYAVWNRKNDSNSGNTSINYAAGKTKKVAWFVSNCADKNGRLSYAKELQKHFQVDIYGSCGTLSCPIVRGNVNCYAMLKKDYKFYLAFENSNCIGYITEKLHWNGLSNDVIPIVMGARPQDYAAAAPPGSYIHVDDFESPRHLADYLKLLDSNDTLYNEYFRYKEQWKIVDIHDTLYWCRICALLHLKDEVKYTHLYEDYNKWWNGACYSRNDGNNPWKTWRPKGYWKNGNRILVTNDLVVMSP